MAPGDFKALNPRTKPRRGEETVYITGTIKWCKHLQPDFQFEAAGKWSVVMYLAGPELEKVRLLVAQKGLKNSIRNDDDGWYITLGRKCTYTVNGRTIGREPPEVFRMADDGETHVPIDSRIGNGSTGVAKCVIWSSPKFPGSNLRWEALRVDNLVEFNPQSDFPDGGAYLEELKQQPTEKLF